MENTLQNCIFICLGTLLQAAAFPDGSLLLDVNYPALISRADLVYDAAADQGPEGIPVGNGRMGSMVWTSPSSLKFQINRVDVFANNAATSSFPERHSDYCGGCAFVDVDFVRFGPDVFDQKASQSLSCYDGLVNVSGGEVAAQVLAWHEQDVIAIYITDQRQQPDAITISLRMLRPPLVKTGNHTALSVLSNHADKIVLTQGFTEGGYYCGSAVAVSVEGRQAHIPRPAEQEVYLLAPAAKGSFTILISSAASFNRDEDLAAKAIAQLEEARAKGYAGLLESNKKWWHDFWSKSFVHLHSDDGTADFIEQNYTYYLYVMASSSRGKYPAKFNGMLWTTGGDRRAWGSQYWGANQSCLYNALIPTGRWELIDPMFDMYTGMYDACALAARQQWGSEGIFIPETCTFDGFASLPEDIAAEMRDLYLDKKPWSEVSQRFRDFAAAKQPHSSRWNWISGGDWQDGTWVPTERPESPFGMVTHIFSRGAKIAYQYWQRYEYTLDEEWLRDCAYPMLKGVAEFYRHFPNLKKEADGKHYIDHVNSNESVRNARHTDEEVSSIMGILPAAIRAAEILQVDPDLRAAWKQLLEHLAPLPVSSEGSQLPRWARALPPAAAGNASGRPDGNTMPQWFFDLCTLENTDASTRRIAETTFEGYLRSDVNAEQRIGVLSKVAVTAAMMGREDVVRYLLPNQLRYPDRAPVLPNRMDQREGPQTTSVQRLGRAADALQNALLQSVGSGPAQPPVIRVFPAWPKEWHAAFTLMARGAFEVTSSVKNGLVEFVEIHSHQGAECRIRNPWTTPVQLWQNGRKTQIIEGALLRFPTQKDQTLVLTQKGISPERFKRVFPPLENGQMNEQKGN